MKFIVIFSISFFVALFLHFEFRCNFVATCIKYLPYSNSARTMTDHSIGIEYSDYYYDGEELYQYRHVVLPKEMIETMQLDTMKLMSEREWRGLGIQQSRGWVHYMTHRPEPHILLFKRPTGTDPTTGKLSQEWIAKYHSVYGTYPPELSNQQNQHNQNLTH